MIHISASTVRWWTGGLLAALLVVPGCGTNESSRGGDRASPDSAYVSIVPPKQEKRVLDLLDDLYQRGSGMMNVPPEDGRFLRLLVAATNTQRVLEIGTSNGVSALWMALGLRETGGRLITMEIDPYRAALARENFKKAHMNDIITLVEGDAFKEIPKLKATFDFIFIDAWKEDYKKFYDLTIPLLERGGLLVAHNTVNAASDMPDFLHAIRDNPELITEVVQVSWSGLSVSYRKR